MYSQWLKEHAQKHKEVVDRLSHLNDDEVIEYFRFENMVKNEPDFCPLYKNNLKCHEMEELNCYLCACPNFRVNSTKSYCDINSKDGGSVTDKNGFVHQDCSQCSVPHKEKYIKDKFSRNWEEIMHDCVEIS